MTEPADSERNAEEQLLWDIFTGSPETRSDERSRVEQSNKVAGIVFDEVKKVWPDLHPLLDLRYGIADAVWAAGLRHIASKEPSDTAIQKVREAVFAQSQRERGAVSGSGLYYPSIAAAITILRAAETEQ